MCSEPRLCDTMLDTSRCCSSSLLHYLPHSFAAASRVICRDQADKTDRHYHLSFVKYWLRRETDQDISACFMLVITGNRRNIDFNFLVYRLLASVPVLPSHSFFFGLLFICLLLCLVAAALYREVTL